MRMVVTFSGGFTVQILIGLVWGCGGHPALSLHSLNEAVKLLQWLWFVTDEQTDGQTQSHSIYRDIA